MARLESRVGPGLTAAPPISSREPTNSGTGGSESDTPTPRTQPKPSEWQPKGYASHDNHKVTVWGPRGTGRKLLGSSGTNLMVQLEYRETVGVISKYILIRFCIFEDRICTRLPPYSGKLSFCLSHNLLLLIFSLKGKKKRKEKQNPLPHSREKYARTSVVLSPEQAPTHIPRTAPAAAPEHTHCALATGSRRTPDAQMRQLT